MDNIYTHRLLDANDVFSSYFIDGKAFYLHSFNVIPNVNFIGNVDGEKVLEAVKENLSAFITNIYQRQWYKRKIKHFVFDKTIVLLSNQIILDISEDYIYLLHDGKNRSVVDIVVELIIRFKKREIYEQRKSSLRN